MYAHTLVCASEHTCVAWDARVGGITCARRGYSHRGYARTDAAGGACAIGSRVWSAPRVHRCMRKGTPARKRCDARADGVTCVWVRLEVPCVRRVEPFERPLYSSQLKVQQGDF